MKTLEQKVNFLTKYAVFTTIFTVALLFFSFKTYNSIENFDQINVKRINVIEDDGTIRMVISNKKLQHSGRMNGKDMDARERYAGAIFFNDEGDECGGLIYGDENIKEGKAAFVSLTMDRYLNDQVIQLINDDYVTNKETISQRGLVVNDVPHGVNLGNTIELFKEAEKIEDKKKRNEEFQKIHKKYGLRNLMFVGKEKDDSQGIFINDAKGNPRLKIYVDKEGNPKFETIDENGVKTDFIK